MKELHVLRLLNKVEFYCDHILYFAGILVDNHLVIITTNANAYVKPVHSRMPVILEKEDIDPWLKDISRTKEILSEVRDFAEWIKK